MRPGELARSVRLLLVVGVLVVLMSCSDNTVTPEAATPAGDPVIQKGIGPGPTAEFETAYGGEVLPGRNSWELRVERGREAQFTVRMTVREGGQVCRSTFHLTELGAPWNETVRELRVDPRTLGPGTYAYPLRWDGTDDDGELLPPGRYHLAVKLKTDSRDCERPMTTEGSGLGQLLLGDTEGEPRYLHPVPI